MTTVLILILLLCAYIVTRLRMSFRAGLRDRELFIDKYANFLKIGTRRDYETLGDYQNRVGAALNRRD